MHMETDTLDGSEYPVYPIYHIGFSWPQEGCINDQNGTSSTMMLKEKNISEVNARAFEIAENLAEQYNVHPSDMDIRVHMTHMEEWCLRWFNHFTFDRGLSDQEVLKSFRRYVWRIERLNQRAQKFITCEDGSILHVDVHCLMGAEDEWRWSGADDTPAPCRCEHCVKRGVVMINH